MFNRRNVRGFTLIELMIVVVIIGILAGLAIPRIIAAPARAEAKEVLHKIFMGEQEYRQLHGCYTIDLTDLGIELPADALCNYFVEIRTDSLSFLPAYTATATSDDFSESWSINQWHQLESYCP